jgi:hypothetical protein
MGFKLHSSHGPPCRHMEAFLNRQADGTAGRFARWYALAHALRCTRCRKYLQALEAMLDRLRKERESRPSGETQAKLTSAVAAAAAQMDF